MLAWFSTKASDDRFWFYHLLYWFGYLLLKFVHLTSPPAVPDRSTWPLLFSYMVIILLNILVTGLLANRLQQHTLTTTRLFRWLLALLLPWSLLVTVLRNHLINLWQYQGNHQTVAEAMVHTYILVFLPLAGWVVGFLLYQSNRQYRLHFNTQQQLLTQARAARLKVLRYQLDPHFMFNTLNALNALIVSRQDQQTEQLIEHLSVFLRHSLQNQHENQVPLTQELEVLQAYLAIQQIRFGPRLQLHWQLMPLPGLHLPPLLLQPLAEQAISSTVTDQAGQIRLRVSLQCTEQQLQFIVSSGPVIAAEGSQLTSAKTDDKTDDSTAAWPAGLQQLAQRLQLLFGASCRLQLNDAAGHFYSEFCLPLEALDVHTQHPHRR